MTTPFGIGSQVWPGLAKVVEEAGELVQVGGKLIAMAGDTGHHDGTDLRQRLVEECGDLLAAIGYLADANGLDAEVALRAAAKTALFRRWHDEERKGLREAP